MIFSATSIQRAALIILLAFHSLEHRLLAQGEATTAGGDAPAAGGESNSESSSDSGKDCGDGKGHDGPRGGRGDHKPPVREGRGHHRSMESQRDLKQAADQMTPDRLHDAQAIMNLNRATMQRAMSDMLFERDVKSGKYDTSDQNEVRKMQSQQAIDTLKSLSQALPENREVTDQQQPKDEVDKALQGQKSPSDAQDYFGNNGSSPAESAPVNVSINLPVETAESRKLANAAEQVVELDKELPAEKPAATTQAAEGTPSAAGSSDHRPMILGLGGFGTERVVDAARTPELEKLALKPEAAASSTSGPVASAPSSRDSVSDATTYAGGNSGSLMELARADGKNSKRKPVARTVASPTKIFDLLGKDKRTFARVQEGSPAREVSSIHTLNDSSVEQPVVSEWDEDPAPAAGNTAAGVALLSSGAMLALGVGLYNRRRRSGEVPPSEEA